MLKRLLFTIRGISLELVDSPRALGTEEVDAARAADDAAAALVLYQQF